MLGFQEARGHNIARDNYIKAIHNSGPMPSDIINDTTKCTQTDDGFWIDQTSIPQRDGNNSTSSNNWRSFGKVNLTGYVNVNRADLIPDGKGGYFVHINEDAIQSSSSSYNNYNNRWAPPSNQHNRISHYNNYSGNRQNDNRFQNTTDRGRSNSNNYYVNNTVSKNRYDPYKKKTSTNKKPDDL